MLPRYTFDYIGTDPRAYIPEALSATNARLPRRDMEMLIRHAADNLENYCWAQGSASNERDTVFGVASTKVGGTVYYRMTADVLPKSSSPFGRTTAHLCPPSMLVFPDLFIAVPEVAEDATIFEAHPAYPLLYGVRETPLDLLTWRALYDCREDDGPCWRVVKPAPTLEQLARALDLVERLLDSEEGEPYEQVLSPELYGGRHG